MSPKTTLAIVLAAMVAAPGLAADNDAAKAQMAAKLGVDPDQYTAAELAQLTCRIEGADSEAERNRILSGIDGFGAVPAEPKADDKAALAASLGVEPDKFTLKELSLIKALTEDDDCNVSDVTAFSKGYESLNQASASAKMQLAKSLGVNPSDYTLAELVKIRLEIESEHGSN